MDKYLVKWIPVDGDVMPNDKYKKMVDTGWGKQLSEECYTSGVFRLAKNIKKVKPFLCTTDIQVGDDIFPILNWETPMICDSTKVYKEGDKAPIGEPYFIWSERLGLSHMKVIGVLKSENIDKVIRWDSHDNIKAIEEMLGDNLISEESNVGTIGRWVKTLEGDIMISWGDYIIKSGDDFSVLKDKICAI